MRIERASKGFCSSSVFCSVMASNAAAAPNPEILPLESLLGDGPFMSR
jgi:hypothetical protein